MGQTGPAAFDANVTALLGLTPAHHIVGFLYIGYLLAEPTGG